MSLLKVAGISGAVCLALYGISTAALYWLMRQPLERFGAIMRHVPNVAMAILPFEPIWMSARAGGLRPGEMAPDFDLPMTDQSRRVRMSEEWRNQPVVLIFGSYT